MLRRGGAQEDEVVGHGSFEGCVPLCCSTVLDSLEALLTDGGGLHRLLGHQCFLEVAPLVPNTSLGVAAFPAARPALGPLGSPGRGGVLLVLRLGEVAPGPHPLGDRPGGAAYGPHPRGREAPVTNARRGGVA